MYSPFSILHYPLAQVDLNNLFFSVYNPSEQKIMPIASLLPYSV